MTAEVESWSASSAYCDPAAPAALDSLRKGFRLDDADEFAKYRLDPAGYARDVLGVSWWSKQVEVAEAIAVHGHRRVFVKASHSVGKTHLAGGLVSWHFDCFDPSITKTTAPTASQVNDLTWKEVRLQRKGRDMLPKAPRIEGKDAAGVFRANHYAAGYTANDANSFQGDHEEHLGLIFEEGVGIREEFFIAADGMLSSGEGNWWLLITNPTDTGSAAYQYELSEDWHVITISAFEHPNIHAQLRGLPKPYPKAVDLSWVEEKVRTWCTPIDARDAKPSDVAWPPLEFCNERGIEPAWYRPGALFEGRVLGRWPSQSTDSVWSEASWLGAVAAKPDLQAESLNHAIEIGCDRARFGDDMTTMHARRGPVSVHHESHNGWDTTRTLAGLKELAGKMGRLCGVDPKRILVKVDDFHGGVVDPAKADGWNFVMIGAGEKAIDEELYVNRRSELWVETADRAYNGRLDFSRLDKESLASLRRQAMAPTWKPNGKGQKVVEPKEATKKRIKRSPDDMDALNLAYAPPPKIPTFGVFTL